MKIGIDASNISSGGGVTHLTQLLEAADPTRDSFSKIIIWTSSRTASQLSPRPWLQVVSPPELDGKLPRRLYWQHLKLSGALAQQSCDVLFSPGGTVPGAQFGNTAHARRCPSISISQNLLPFMPEEIARYRLNPFALQQLLLRYSQSGTFKRAAGVIFLSEFARSLIQSSIGKMKGQVQIIPHGIHKRFFKAPRTQKPMTAFSKATPFKLVYVSIVHFYKHQWNVAEAVSNLRKRGLPIEIDFVGGAYAPAMARLRRALAVLDPSSEFIRYRGEDSFTDMHSTYHNADAFIFASTCENMPNILLEAMASGLPIISSNHGPMPEVLGNAGLYMDPLNVADITQSIENMVLDHNLRATCADSAFERAKPFDWETSARSTFAFIRRSIAQWA